jgi:hypothetical protein
MTLNFPRTHCFALAMRDCCHIVTQSHDTDHFLSEFIIPTRTVQVTEGFKQWIKHLVKFWHCVHMTISLTFQRSDGYDKLGIF